MTTSGGTQCTPSDTPIPMRVMDDNREISRTISAGDPSDEAPVTTPCDRPRRALRTNVSLRPGLRIRNTHPPGTAGLGPVRCGEPAEHAPTPGHVDVQNDEPLDSKPTGIHAHRSGIGTEQPLPNLPPKRESRIPTFHNARGALSHFPHHPPPVARQFLAHLREMNDPPQQYTLATDSPRSSSPQSRSLARPARRLVAGCEGVAKARPTTARL